MVRSGEVSRVPVIARQLSTMTDSPSSGLGVIDR